MYVYIIYNIICCCWLQVVRGSLLAPTVLAADAFVHRLAVVCVLLVLDHLIHGRASALVLSSFLLACVEFILAEARLMTVSR